MNIEHYYIGIYLINLINYFYTTTALRASIIYIPAKGKEQAPIISSPSTSPSQPIYIGLDLGTVYSTVSIWKGGKPLLLNLQGVNRVLSMVAGDDIHPKVYFGKDAMELVAC